MMRKFLVLVGGAAILLGCPAGDDENTSNAGETETEDDEDDDESGEETPTTMPATASMTGDDSASGPNPTTSDSASDSDPTTGDSASASDTEPGETDSSSESESDTVDFILDPDGGGATVECDVWEDDCPDDEKCMPWANDGGNSWNATRCSPVSGDPGQVGDACTVEGSGVSGVDSCDARSMCYYVDGETNEGICVGFCDGSPMAPTCDNGFICTIVNDGVLTLCRPECDPLLQDCEGSAACLQATGALGFTCIVDASGEGGQAGDPCEFINSCDPGLFCGTAETIPGCKGTGCCTEFCDLTDEGEPASVCSGQAQGQECLGWFADGEAPPGLEHVGVCALPV